MRNWQERGRLMKKIFGPIIGVLTFVGILYFLSYVLPPLAEFLGWWFVTSETIKAPLTTGQVILIDLITHGITYLTVGVIFGSIGWWNSECMHYVYIVISEVISLLLALLLRFIIAYYWIIFIVLGLFVLLGILFYFLPKKEVKEEQKDKVFLE